MKKDGGSLIYKTVFSDNTCQDAGEGNELSLTVG